MQFWEHCNACICYTAALGEPFLITCSCLLSDLLKGVFVNGSCLSLPTCCSSEGWPRLGSEKIDRTLRCYALCCHALRQQVGKSEGCCLAHYGRPHGRGCLGAFHTQGGEHTTLHANEAKRSLCASGHDCTKLFKIKNSSSTSSKKTQIAGFFMVYPFIFDFKAVTS